MNYYHILGVSESASQQDIKRQFRKLALEHHPDKSNHQSDHHFKMINEAYQVLSDPQKKANYDYRLKYQFVNPTSFTAAQQNYTQKKTSPSFSDQQRQYYQKQQEKAKIAEDKRFFRQIALTIGFIFLSAMAMIYYNNQQEEKIAEEKLVQENLVTTTISESKQLITEKNYKEALTKLSITYKKYEFNERLNTESKQILEGLLSLSHFYMEQNDFAHALKIYEAIYEFAPLEDKEIYKMATCYRSEEKFDKAIELLAFLIKNNYPDYNYLYDMASIYDFDLNEHEKAVHYYELATQDIVEKYESVFGKAYIVTLNPDKLPKKHFAVFYDKGMNYYRLKEYEKALGAFKWANNLQRDNDISLYYQGVCYYELKQKNDACDCWKQAYSFQKKDQIKEKINQFCK